MWLELLQNIPTGGQAIDEYLGGGLPVKDISLIYGEAETGKTTLAMQSALNCARSGLRTLFVDCDNTFSVQRLDQLARKEFTDLSKLILLARPLSFSEQASIIDQLNRYVTKNFGLLVFDTFTSLYRLRVSESPSKTFELNRELNRQLAVLAQTVKLTNIAVLLTSQVHSVLGELPVNIEPVATRVLKFWSQTIISLKPTRDPCIMEAILEKTPQKSRSIASLLRIGESGIH
jgi:RecA/RadA recombinase